MYRKIELLEQMKKEVSEENKKTTDKEKSISFSSNIGSGIP